LLEVIGWESICIESVRWGIRLIFFNDRDSCLMRIDPFAVLSRFKGPGEERADSTHDEHGDPYHVPAEDLLTDRHGE